MTTATAQTNPNLAFTKYSYSRHYWNWTNARVVLGVNWSFSLNNAPYIESTDTKRIVRYALASTIGFGKSHHLKKTTKSPLDFDPRGFWPPAGMIRQKQSAYIHRVRRLIVLMQMEIPYVSAIQHPIDVMKRKKPLWLVWHGWQCPGMGQ